jgi:predicted nucleic acid-binding protein
LKKDLSDHKKVGIDTSVFRHHFEGDRFSELTTVLLKRIQDGHCTGVVSTVCLAEVLVKPLKKGQGSLADLYRVLFHEMPNLETVPVDQVIASRAAALAAEHGFDLVDSIMLATALEAGATAFITNNEGLRTVNGLRILLLDDYLG